MNIKVNYKMICDKNDEVISRRIISSQAQTGILSVEYYKGKEFYCGLEMPAGTLACDVLNIDDELIKKLQEIVDPISEFHYELYFNEKVDKKLMNDSADAIYYVIKLLKDVKPFSYIGEERIMNSYMSFFTPENCEKAYREMMRMTEPARKFQQWTAQTYMLVDGIFQFKHIMAGVVDRVLSSGKHKIADYADAVERCFDITDNFPMSIQNKLITGFEYVSYNKSLKRRMNHLFFTTIFRADFYEGLAVGNAPSLCENCGKYWLATNGNVGKYCDGIDPKDEKHRPCRNIGTAKGRKYKNLAENDPVMYEARKAKQRAKSQRRTNSISPDQCSEIYSLIDLKAKKANRDYNYLMTGFKPELTMENLKREIGMGAG